MDSQFPVVIDEPSLSGDMTAREEDFFQGGLFEPPSLLLHHQGLTETKTWQYCCGHLIISNCYLESGHSFLKATVICGDFNSPMHFPLVSEFFASLGHHSNL